jgi:hypothetical protein
MSGAALHALAAVVCWLLGHPYAPVLFCFTFAAWAWWAALFREL